MDFHIGAELLSCWFHFRITLPHIYWISDYFWIQIGRDWTTTWVGEHCFDSPKICNIVLLNPQVSNSFEHYSVYGLRLSLPTSHWTNKYPFSSVPVSWDCLRRRSQERGKPRPHQQVLPFSPSFAIPLLGNPLQHPPGLWRSELTAESERYLQGEKGNTE